MNDAVEAVRALLDAGADPNARWSQRNDRFPLQEAIEGSSYGNGNPGAHRAEIIRGLLLHGADPAPSVRRPRQDVRRRTAQRR